MPFPDLTTYAVGALEIAGGAALVLGLLVRPVALVLAANLVVAVCTAGRVDGGAVNLGLAPALIVVLARARRAGQRLRACETAARRLTGG